MWISLLVKIRLYQEWLTDGGNNWWQLVHLLFNQDPEYTRRTLLRQTLNGRLPAWITVSGSGSVKGFYGWFSASLNSGFISIACYCLIYSSCYSRFILLVLEFYFYFIPHEIQFRNVKIPVLLTLETSSHKA